MLPCVDSSQIFPGRAVCYPDTLTQTELLGQWWTFDAIFRCEKHCVEVRGQCKMERGTQNFHDDALGEQMSPLPYSATPTERRRMGTLRLPCQTCHGTRRGEHTHCRGAERRTAVLCVPKAHRRNENGGGKVKSTVFSTGAIRWNDIIHFGTVSDPKCAHPPLHCSGLEWPGMEPFAS